MVSLLTIACCKKPHLDQLMMMGMQSVLGVFGEQVQHNNSVDRFMSGVLGMAHSTTELDCWTYCCASICLCHLLQLFSIG
uniref:Uncharacterized protein n=1 Tax=Kalanchoe fedtschenkoi TaxID=63787 RepID=A0A7N0TV08_KALFE